MMNDPVKIADEAIRMFLEELDRRGLRVASMSVPSVISSAYVEQLKADAVSARAAAVQEVREAMDFADEPGEGPDDLAAIIDADPGPEEGKPPIEPDEVEWQ